MERGDPARFGFGDQGSSSMGSAGRRRRRSAEDIGDGVADRSVRRRMSAGSDPAFVQAADFPASAGHGISGILQADFVPAWDEIPIVGFFEATDRPELEHFPVEGFFEAEDFDDLFPPDGYVGVEGDPPENVVSAESWPTTLLPPQRVIVAYDFLSRFDAVRAGNIEPEDEDPHARMRLDTDRMSYEDLLGLEERIGQARPKRPLSEEEALARIKDVIPLSDDDETCCALCLNEFKEEDKLGLLSCGHMFHKDGLLRWLKYKPRVKCPLCRQEPQPF